ncbi:hypothetical protein [uncultured Azohydromonas sp.]|jgi:hypothetical protein|uniref:hypothetical protein n=1 Tax=uncultured Azohydromonas sp. TaxID=487342 RepID=UPI00262EBAAC|nr:hypothetical protein [uncultured Azohydromonas sp.]
MHWPFKPATKEEHFGMAMEEGSMRQLRVTIPDGIEFADLCLSRDVGEGQVRFKIAPIEAICEASALDLDQFLEGPEPLVGLLIAAWYAAHIRRGGPPDPVQEDIMEEARLEEEHGGGFSYPPGHA